MGDGVRRITEEDRINKLVEYAAALFRDKFKVKVVEIPICIRGRERVF